MAGKIDGIQSGIHIVQPGDTFWSIHKKTGISWDTIKALNSDIDIDNLQVGQQIRLSAPASDQSIFTDSVSLKAASTIETEPAFSTQTETKQPEINKATAGKEAIALYEANLSEEEKAVTPLTKAAEGISYKPYIEPNGRLDIAHGHYITNSPKFVKDIEKSNLSNQEKEAKLAEKLQDPKNKEALKKALKKNLENASKVTGIKGVSTDINDDLKLSPEQVNLLFYSDIKKAKDGAIKDLGQETWSRMTPGQKAAAIDIQYSTYGIEKSAPSFRRNLQAGNIDGALNEIDLFYVNKKPALGLIRRNYQRQLLMKNGVLTDEIKKKDLNAYNACQLANGRREAKTFEEIVPIISHY